MHPDTPARSTVTFAEGEDFAANRAYFTAWFDSDIDLYGELLARHRDPVVAATMLHSRVARRQGFTTTTADLYTVVVLHEAERRQAGAHR